jgi:hypothetical protein
MLGEMKMNDTNIIKPSRLRFPVSLGIAAGYFILTGTLALVWPFLGIGPHHPEFQAKSIAFKGGAYSRELTFGILFLVSGVGLFLRKSWARKLALVMLVITTIYISYEFAWGFAGGRPNPAILGMSFAIVGAWNAIWFFLIFKKSSKESIITQQAGRGERE